MQTIARELWPNIWHYMSFPQVIKMRRISTYMQSDMRNYYHPKMICFFDARVKLVRRDVLKKIIQALPNIFSKTKILNLCQLQNCDLTIVQSLHGILNFVQIEVLLVDTLSSRYSAIQHYFGSVSVLYCGGGEQKRKMIKCHTMLTFQTGAKKLIEFGMYRQHLTGIINTNATVEQLEEAVLCNVHHYAQIGIALHAMRKVTNLTILGKLFERLKTTVDLSAAFMIALDSRYDVSMDELNIILDRAKQIPNWKQTLLYSTCKFDLDKLLYVQEQGLENDDYNNLLHLFDSSAFEKQEQEVFEKFEQYRLQHGKPSLTSLFLRGMNILHIAVAANASESFIDMLIEQYPHLLEWKANDWNITHSVALAIELQRVTGWYVFLAKYEAICGADFVAMANVEVPKHGTFFNILMRKRCMLSFGWKLFCKYPELNIHYLLQGIVWRYSRAISVAIQEHDNDILKSIFQNLLQLYECTSFHLNGASIVELFLYTDQMELYCSLYNVSMRNVLEQQHPTVPQCTIGMHLLQIIALGNKPISHIYQIVLLAMDLNPDYSLLLEAAKHRQAHVIHHLLPLRPVIGDDKQFVQYFSKSNSMNRNVLGQAFKYGLYIYTVHPEPNPRSTRVMFFCKKCCATFFTSKQLEKHKCR